MLRQWYEKLRESRIPMLLFYVGLTIELLIVLVDKSKLSNPYESYLFRLTFLIFLAKLVLTKRDVREWIFILILEILAVISYRVTGRNDVVRIVTFVAACKDIQIKQAMKYIFWVTLSGCMLIVLLAVTGIYGDVSLLAAYGRDFDVYAYYDGAAQLEETVRYTLGMGHPNAVSCMFFMVIAAGTYAYFDRLKWYGYLFMEAVNLLVFYLTDSKTTMFVTTLFILGACLMKYIRWLRESAFTYVCVVLIFILCLGVSLDMAMFAPQVQQAKYDRYYNGIAITDSHIKLLAFVDEHTSGRITTLAGTENDEGTVGTWSLFSEQKNMTYYFDTGWVKLFYRYGIVWGMLFVAAGMMLIWKFYRQKDAAGLVMFATFALYTIVEAHLISPYIGRNWLLVLMGYYLLQNSKQRQKLK